MAVKVQIKVQIQRRSVKHVRQDDLVQVNTLKIWIFTSHGRIHNTTCRFWEPGFPLLTLQRSKLSLTCWRLRTWQLSNVAGRSLPQYLRWFLRVSSGKRCRNSVKIYGGPQCNCHIKTKLILTANYKKITNRSQQIQIAHSKFKSLTANSNRSQRITNRSPMAGHIIQKWYEQTTNEGNDQDNDR